MAQDTDDTLSGTTAVCVLIRGREVTICNVGDSRCVAAESRGAELVAVDLTQDQTPYRCVWIRGQNIQRQMRQGCEW